MQHMPDEVDSFEPRRQTFNTKATAIFDGNFWATFTVTITYIQCVSFWALRVLVHVWSKTIGGSDAIVDCRAARLHVSDWDSQVSDRRDTCRTCCQLRRQVHVRHTGDDAREFFVRLWGWRLLDSCISHLVAIWNSQLSRTGLVTLNRDIDGI